MKLGVAAIWGWVPSERPSYEVVPDAASITLVRDGKFLSVRTNMPIEQWTGILIAQDRFSGPRDSVKHVVGF
jgi:hypothetical protein